MSLGTPKREYQLLLGFVADGKEWIGGELVANLATARPGWDLGDPPGWEQPALLPLRDDSKETDTASTPSFVTAGSKIL